MRYLIKSQKTKAPMLCQYSITAKGQPEQPPFYKSYEALITLSFQTILSILMRLQYRLQEERL